MYLKREAERRGLKFKDVVGKIRGYSVEVNSHADVARAIEEGGADAGFGIKSVANTSGLGFLPMTQENFDFVIEEKRLRKPLVRVFLEELSSKKFAGKARIVGLYCSKDTGNVIYRP
jgi:putative molybdopterin biosynthesis protein